ncbi:MAG: YggS family pyridoxal phosphate-dependent enzyme [Treponema sp.]|nr:YggS family pyridoxal phosphate-dependent enzyme [Treponema sp.]
MEEKFCISKNLDLVSEKIHEAERNAGRKEGSVRLLAVSKFHPVDSVFAAASWGQTLFGENRVQEASGKFPEVFEKYPEVKLHIIGQLQTNKVKAAVKIADTIQSVDRLDLIKEIEKQASKINRVINIFFELHTGEESKSGFSSKEEIVDALNYIAEGNAPHVVPKGFMTMAPFTEDEALVRKSFVTLRTVRDELQSSFPQFDLSELSMGMSGDYEIAIEEGSTMVRVGTAIFGERQY